MKTLVATAPGGRTPRPPRRINRDTLPAVTAGGEIITPATTADLALWRALLGATDTAGGAR